MSLNGDPLGSVFLDSAGGTQNIISPRGDVANTLREQLKMAQHPFIAKFFGTPLVKGQRSETDFALSDVVPKEVINDVIAKSFSLNERVTVQYELVAFRLMSGRRVAELRFAFPNLLRRSWAAPGRANVSIDSLSGTHWQFVDVDSGFGVALYEIIEISMRIQGKSATIRYINSLHLNPSKSHGL